jgi:hypothetical protein
MRSFARNGFTRRKRSCKKVVNIVAIELFLSAALHELTNRLVRVSREAELTNPSEVERHQSIGLVGQVRLTTLATAQSKL